MTIKMQDGMMFGALGDIDGACEHITRMMDTKAAILEYIEPMAQVLAQAGRASAKAMGDSTEYAIDQWSTVIRDRAIEILRQDGRPQREEYARQIRKLLDK